MGIELWSRREGIVRPPDGPFHATDESRSFPQTARTRVQQWSFEALGRLSWGTALGDVVNDPRYSLKRLLHDLCSAYGRVPLVPISAFGPAVSSADNEAPAQLPMHLKLCLDIEVLDYIDALFQESAWLIESYGGADPETEQALLAAEINRIFEEEGIGYRRAEGRLLRFNDEITHREAFVPAIAALATGEYGEANMEFGSAMDNFGRGAYRDALTNANAALESVLQVLTGKKGTAGELIPEAGPSGTDQPRRRTRPRARPLNRES